MPHGPRRFAKNSDNVRHFRLVARSQHDPDGEDEEASPLVLEPYVPTKVGNKLGGDEAAYGDLLSIPESLKTLGPEVFGLDTRDGPPTNTRAKDYVGNNEENDDEDELAELDDDCYFPKDGYNYNQHLKTLSSNKKKGGYGGVVVDAVKKKDDPDPVEVHRIQPAETDEQQEVMAALEAAALEADLYEELDDGLLECLQSSGVAAPEVTLWGPNGLEYADLPDLAAYKEMQASRFASMAGGEGDDDEDDEEGSEGAPAGDGAVSSAQFEQLLDDEYADEEIGDLEEDEIEGNMDLENMEDVLDEFLEERQADKHMLESLYEPTEGKLDDCPRVTEETKAIIERWYEKETEEDEDTSEGESEEDESKNWDVETVLSTLSNVSNRPGKIGKIKVLKKPAPTKELPAIGEDASDADNEDEEPDTVELPDVVLERPKNESTEDKRQRKAAVKEMRRICRRMKKESKDMYKQEELKMSKRSQGNGDVRDKLRCVKL